MTSPIGDSHDTDEWRDVKYKNIGLSIRTLGS
jgi:hypothetical protein